MLLLWLMIQTTIPLSKIVFFMFTGFSRVFRTSKIQLTNTLNFINIVWVSFLVLSFTNFNFQSLTITSMYYLYFTLYEWMQNWIYKSIAMCVHSGERHIIQNKNMWTKLIHNFCVVVRLVFIFGCERFTNCELSLVRDKELNAAECFHFLSLVKPAFMIIIIYKQK